MSASHTKRGSPVVTSTYATLLDSEEIFLEGEDDEGLDEEGIEEEDVQGIDISGEYREMSRSWD